MKWSVLFRIDVDDVLDIMPIEQDDEHGTDLFKTIFTDEFRQLAWQLATDLSYTDEECFASTLREHIQTLSNVLSDSPELESVGLSGFVLVPSDSDNVLQEEFVNSSRAYVDGVNFVKYKEVIHAVLEVMVFDQLGDSPRKVYAIPSQDRLLRLESLHDGAGDLEFAVTSLHDITQDVREIFKSDAFYGFSLEEQLEILKQYDDEAYNVLAAINEPQEFSGECTVMAYRCLPSDLLKIVSWCDAPLQQPGDNQGAETFTLQVDKLAVWNPELNDPLGLDGSLQKATDLPLSFGEPVLMVGSRKNDMFYLVRARDIVGLSRSN